MNSTSIYKTTILTVLFIFSFYVLDWAVPVAEGAKNSRGLWAEKNLTEEEQAFLLQHPVLRLGVGVKFPPFQYVENESGVPVFKGMVSSYLDLVEGRLGIKLKPVYGISFKEALEMGRSKQIDLFPCISQTPERQKYLVYTETYLSYPLVIITREDAPLVSRINDLEGRKIAVVKFLATYSKLTNDYPDLNFDYLFRNNIAEVLEAVSLGEADACIANLAVSSYEINKRGLYNLRVASPTPWANNNLAMAVRDDWQIMQGILNKVLESISVSEKNAISERWIRLKIDSVLDSSKVWSMALKVSGVFLLVFCGILYWNRRLHKEISEREKAESMLLESEERYKQLSIASFEAIFLSENGVIINMNKAAEEMFGYVEQETEGLHLLKFFHQNSRDLVAEKLILSEDTSPYMTTALRRDGTSFPCEVQARMSTHGDKKIRITALRDISRRMEAEEKRARSERIFRRIFESSPLPMLEVEMSGLVAIFAQWKKAGITDVEEYLRENPEELKKCMDNINVVTLNEASVVLHGADDKSQLIGQVSNYLSLESLSFLDRVISELASGRTYFHDEIHWENLKGRNLDTLIYIDVVDGYEHSLARVLITLVDITEKKRLEETIIQAEKMISIGGLAAGMAHEINNPLAGILQGVQNIRRRFSDKYPANVEAAELAGVSFPAMVEYMEKRKVFTMLNGVQQSGERAARIVQNMLNFSRGSSAVQVYCDINGLLDQTIEVVSNDFDMEKKYDFKKIKIFRDYDPQVNKEKCIPSELEQVFLNMFKNAAQAMGEKEYTAGSGPELQLITEVNEKDTIIRVRDNGPGIDPGDMKHIFDPFFSTKVPGAGIGLGLSVSYFIVTENHGGSLEVFSQPGEWTEFVVRLPR
ncbi:PAS domain S-box protein [Maridesulfovibrio sp.]|uniref:PAS domain S-box protein n=1 Tax=Maridesulfovibrio sp. TaxID=2795000 RepID=UPI003B00AFCF